MKKVGNLVLFIALMAMFVNDVKAYDNEVWEESNMYYWKINGAQAGSSANLSTAISSCIGNDREVHILTSGTLTSTLTIRSTNVKLFCHDNTLTCNFTGSGIINNGNDGLEIHDLTLRNVVGGYGIRSSAASNLSFTNLTLIDIGWLGMRIDSRTSNPWNYTIYNVYMRDCHFENTGGHGLEFYSIDGLTLEGTMTARHNGDCGVLLNNCHNATIETVDAYDCNWGGGYAGLRYANGCSNVTTNQLYADHCGRGFFIVQSGPTVNCHVNNVQIGECSGLGIWIENGTNCSVKDGCCESPVSVSGTGSYANVSNSCEDVVVPVSLEEGYYQISPVHSGLCMQSNTTPTQQTCSDIQNQIWRVIKDGDNYQLLNVATNQYWSEGSGVQGQNTGMSSSPVSLTFTNAGGGSYYISPEGNTSLVFDILNVSTAQGEPTILWVNTGATNQHFTFTPVDIQVDCHGDPYGEATLDECGVCTGGQTGVTACTGSIEAEEACAYDGSIDNNNAGFSGTGFVNTTNVTGSSITLSVEATSAMTVDLGFVYANGGAPDRPAAVLVNGNNAGTLQFATTSAWTMWENETTGLALEAGLNLITLIATTANGIANLDQIIIYDNGITLGSCAADCNGDIAGSATTDACGKCIGGNTGETSDDADNDGILDCDDAFPNDFDNDGITTNVDCDDTNPSIRAARVWYADADNDGVGDANSTLEDCTQPLNYVSTAGDECPNDGNKTIPGDCGCGQTEQSCLDCAGIPNGTTEYDDCGVCGGSNACLDCAGTPNGDAYYDNCDNCVEGSTGLEPCTQDCSGEWGGTAEYDACNECTGGDTGLEPVTDPNQCLATGIEGLEDNSMKIHPNPTTGKVYLSEKMTWVVLDLFGNILKEGASAILDLEGFASGIYFLKINHRMVKIIKE